MNLPIEPPMMRGIDFGKDEGTVISLWMREQGAAPRAGSTAAGMCLLMESVSLVLNKVAWICYEHATRPIISELYKRLAEARLFGARRARVLRRRGVRLYLAPPTSTGKARYQYFPRKKS